MSIRGSSYAGLSTNNITISLPAGSQAGDLAVLFVSAAAAVTNPSGWANQFQLSSGLWTVLATTKVLSSGDISAGNVTINCPSGTFDMAAGMVTFIGSGGGVRETEGAGAGSGTITNTTTGAVVSTDTAIYWASSRFSGTPTIPTITPGTGSATALQSGTTTNAYSLLADQAMPGGALAVVTSAGLAITFVAVQVIVESSLSPSGGLLINPGMDGGMVPQMKGGMNG